MACAAALLATSPARPTAFADLTLPLDLGSGDSIAYAVDLSVESGDLRIEHVELDVRAVEDVAEPYSDPLQDVAIAVIPSELRVTGASWMFGGSGVDLTDACSEECAGRVWVVARAVGDGAADAEGLALHLDAQGEGTGTDLLGATATLVHDGGDDAMRVATPVRSAIQTSAPVHGDALAIRTVRLRIAAEALVGPLEFPLVGRLWILPNTTSTYSAYTTVQVADDQEFVPTRQDRWTDVDWLGRCTTGADCEVTFELVASVDAEYYDGNLPDDLEVHWELLATLDAFDGRDLPVDALTLTVDD